MSIYPIQMFGCKCDGCGEVWDNGDSVMAYQDEDHVRYSIEESGWHITEEKKTYCPDCHSIDDNDQITFKTTNPHTNG